MIAIIKGVHTMTTSVWNTLARTANTTLGAVASTATMATKLIESGSASVDMLDRFVQRANTKQRFAHEVEDSNWREATIDSAAESNAQREYELEKKLSANRDLALKFTENRQRLAAQFLTQPE